MFKFVVAAIFKNEGHIIEEWLNHYITEGVDYFILIDNGSTDSYITAIQPHIDSGRVDLIIDPEKHGQLEKYNKYVLPKVKQSQSDWLLVVDLDEFVYGRRLRLADYLKGLPASVAQVSCPWKLYGSSGHIRQPGSVISNFLNRQRMSSLTVTNIKSIVRVGHLTSIGIHEHITEDEYTHIEPSGRDLDAFRFIEDPALVTFDEDFLSRCPVHINHYAIQSWEWFKAVKMTRGSANIKEHDHVRDQEYFKRYDFNDITDDELATKHHIQQT